MKHHQFQQPYYSYHLSLVLYIYIVHTYLAELYELTNLNIPKTCGHLGMIPRIQIIIPVTPREDQVYPDDSRLISY